MGRVFPLCLGLLVASPGAVQAQITQSGTISGPDGTGPRAPMPRAAHPSLEEQLRRKKGQEPPPPLPQEPAMSTDELLTPAEKKAADELQISMNLKNERPRFRMHLGLAPATARKLAGPADRFHFDPGLVWQSAYRLTDPERSFTFWTGLYLAAWNGNARSEASFSRFAAFYAGPLFAFEWKEPLRHTLAFGLAGVNRQADPEFPGDQLKQATKRYGLDGSGFWLNYGLGFKISQGFEWEVKAGIQTSSSYMLSYVSVGVSLWTD